MTSVFDIKQYRRDLLQTFVEVALYQPSDFLKVKETLTRIGIASRSARPTLFQTCHILHKQQHYHIVHFKELFLLDGKFQDTIFSEEDRARRNLIVQLLMNWRLVSLVSEPTRIQPQLSYSDVTVVSFAQKPDWSLVPKYTIGRKLHGSESIGV